MIQIRKAQRRKAKLRMALLGPSGSGKTMSALKLAFGMGGKVGVIDTENGSADLYADIGEYDVITLEKPYTVQKYREALNAFESAGYATVIVDSLTHAWSGEGGLLDKQGRMAAKPGANSYAAWREVTPDHNALVEALLSSRCHIIGTMRVKTEYVLETNDRGKQVPRKVGLQPVQRDGMEYEFTVVMDVDINHKASASKDRTTIFDGWYDVISEDTGRRVLAWLESGEDALPASAPPAPEPPPAKEPGWPIIAPDGSLKEVAARSWLAAVGKALALLESAEAVREWRRSMGPHVASIAEIDNAKATEADRLIAARLDELTEQKEAA